MTAIQPEIGGAAHAVHIHSMPRFRSGWRIFLFYSSALILTGFVSLLFADLLWRTGWSASSTILFALFTILFLLAAIGCTTGVYGFLLRRAGDRSITTIGDFRAQGIDGTSTAIVFPIYNEQVGRVYEGLRATFHSLQRTGQLSRFDFFILSDSTNSDNWIEEERRWFDLVRELNALGRVHYRRRLVNEGRKSGNIRDFLNTWGRRYRYFIVFDADSVMRGETVVDLVKLMEAHPDVGLIQTVPGLMNGESLFGRIQQFANRLYAPLFMSGLNFWTQNCGNYWGHNAIIRTEPFMQYCDLPHLPGAKPLGGQILSHDFVEAALLLKANWKIWYAYELGGSYEEAPQDMIENAKRDRRWCQGNLQHGMVLFARGLRGTSRIHLLLGIFGYLASPLWLLFLLTYNFSFWFKQHTGLSVITVRALTPFIRNGTQHAFLIFVICLCVLFLPKLLALIDLALDPPRRRSFGGLRNATVSAVLETLFSALHAPLQMLWHSKFVVTILGGMGVHWGGQRRTADGIGWPEAIRNHWAHTLIGLVWGALVWRIDKPTLWWFAPVLAGMLCSIPLSVFTSRGSLGERARRLRLFLTPEETSPPPELVMLRNNLARSDSLPFHMPSGPDEGVARAVLDPYINALHVSLLREKRLNPEIEAELLRLGVGKPAVRTLAEKMLAEGPASLGLEQKLLVLSDAETLSWLHHHAWLLPGESLAPWWQTAIRQYAR